MQGLVRTGFVKKGFIVYLILNNLTLVIIRIIIYIIHEGSPLWAGLFRSWGKIHLSKVA